jgi:hypothetical protein
MSEAASGVYWLWSRISLRSCGPVRATAGDSRIIRLIIEKIQKVHERPLAGTGKDVVLMATGVKFSDHARPPH